MVFFLSIALIFKGFTAVQSLLQAKAFSSVFCLESMSAPPVAFSCVLLPLLKLFQQQASPVFLPFMCKLFQQACFPCLAAHPLASLATLMSNALHCSLAAAAGCSSEPLAVLLSRQLPPGILCSAADPSAVPHSAFKQRACAWLEARGGEHINLTGDYVWQQNRLVKQGRFRPLRTCDES